MPLNALDVEVAAWRIKRALQRAGSLKLVFIAPTGSVRSLPATSGEARRVHTNMIVGYYDARVEEADLAEDILFVARQLRDRV